MTYEQILSRAPLSTASGNLAEAKTYADFLSTIIENDRESFGQLNASQQRYLYRLRVKWQTRAAGLDLRWNVCGVRPGRPPSRRTAAGQPRHRSQDDLGETSPLFQSLVKKYGRPGIDDTGDSDAD